MRQRVQWDQCTDTTPRIIALPVVFAHSDMISTGALVMSVAGGLLIYGTIISFGMFFQEESEF